jgi:hypothetical protein
VGALNKLYLQYRDRVEFRLVYIREAHPTDGWQVPANLRDSILFEDPKDLEQRRVVAGACVKTLGIQFPALVDTVDDAVESQYAGWPDRIYVIDLEGKIAYKGAPGPRGFVVPEAAAAVAKLAP